MSHDPKHDHHSQHDHDHSHDHCTVIPTTTTMGTTIIDHDHSHDHHLHHSHDWHSDAYVNHWVEHDAARMAERKPIIEALIAAVPFPPDASIDVLDVGGGFGVLTEAVIDAFPAARVTLQDFSEQMLARGRERFAAHDRAIRFVQCDLTDPTWPQKVGGPFDLAVSAIAIHNLKDLAAMGSCYEAVHGLLKPGGCFLDYDLFDKFGGVPLHQHSMKVAGFKSVEAGLAQHPIAVLKATK